MISSPRISEFSKYISELQEAVDHHTNFTMKNFDTVEILLSTHQPVPGITTVDVEFAQHFFKFFE